MRNEELETGNGLALLFFNISLFLTPHFMTFVSRV